MTVNDLNPLQRYLVEEEAEHWQHGWITRREFIRRVTLLVGGAAAAAGVLSALGCDTSAPEPGPTAGAAGTTLPATRPSAYTPEVPENSPLIHSSMVDVPSANTNIHLKGYMSTPQARGGPGKPGAVLVVHDNRALSEYIKDVVRRVAIAGYGALCVDLLSRAGGTGAHPTDTDRIGTLGQIPERYLLSDLNDGLNYLKSRDDLNGNSLATIGFCFGGGLVWSLVTQRADLKSAVPFYGPSPNLADVRFVKAAVLGIYAGNDTRITGAVPPLEEALKTYGITYEIKIYPDVDHGFHRNDDPTYNEAAAKDAWNKTLAWLGTHM